MPSQDTSTSDFAPKFSLAQTTHHRRQRSDAAPPPPPPRRRASYIPQYHVSHSASNSVGSDCPTIVSPSARNSYDFKFADPLRDDGRGKSTHDVQVVSLGLSKQPQVAHHHGPPPGRHESTRGQFNGDYERSSSPEVEQQATNEEEVKDEGDHSHPRPKLNIRTRLAHFTWAWYTLTMSTGGLSLLIFAQPHQFPGLRQIGLVVYIINLILFVLVTSAIITRFFLHPGTFKKSVSHPREGFFFPTFFLSVATIITSTQRYTVRETSVPLDGSNPPGPPGLLWVIQAAFWAYVVLTTILAVGQYSFLFASHTFLLANMMPTWILPIFPVMLSGTIASVIAGTQPISQSLPIITAGLTCQGLGLAVAAMMYAHMVGRLMQEGLPDREHRPGLFMCVGPPAFTALAFIGLARSLPSNFDHDMDGLLDTNIIRTMAIIGAGFLWALSFWWFGIAVVAVAQKPPKFFHLGWWATVFPNTGFTLATISLGNEFQNEPVLWFATVMSIFLLVTYGFVLFHHVRAVLVQDIMYPGRDEDVEDH